MTKKLFKVEVQTSFVVAAETAEAAEKWAKENTYEWSRYELEDADYYAQELKSATTWVNTYPWNDEEGKPVNAWFPESE